MYSTAFETNIQSDTTLVHIAHKLLKWESLGRLIGLKIWKNAEEAQLPYC